MNPPNLSSGQIGGLGLGATAGGGLMQAFGSLASGFANKSMYDYQASISKLNQQIAAQNAELARQTGEQQALNFGLRASQQMGQIKTAQASAGFDVRSGSDAQVRASQRMLNETDLNMIRSNAAKTAYGFQEQGTIAGAQAQVYDMAGAQSLVAGGMGAGASILGGAASVSSEWLQGQRVGLWGNS